MPKESYSVTLLVTRKETINVLASDKEAAQDAAKAHVGKYSTPAKIIVMETERKAQ